MNDLGVSLVIGVIKAGVFIHDVISYPIYALLQQPWRQKKKMEIEWAKEIPCSDGACIRSQLPIPELRIEMTKNNLDTVAKAHRWAFTKYADSPVMGTRTVLSMYDETQPNGKVFQKVEMGEYTWITYKEAYETALAFGRGVRVLGQKPKENVIIFAETRAEWMLTAIGVISQNVPLVTLYPTLGEEALIHAIIESEASLIVTSHELMPKVKSMVKRCHKVDTIIYFEDQLQNTQTGGVNDVKFYPFKEVTKIGKNAIVDVSEPKAEDTCIIMYTSGSTGAPKGVVMTHRNLCSSFTGFATLIKPMRSDIFLSYLPLSHVLELTGESMMLMAGARLGYSSTHTMTDRSTKIKRGTSGDVSVLRPTVLPAVPLVLDRLYKGILDKVAAQGKFLTALFAYGVQYRMSWSECGWDTPFCNWFVFRKIRALLGGNIRVIATGGAPLAPKTHRFIRAAVGVPVIQGYGLTETCGCATLMHPDDVSCGNVGPPLYMCDIKLVDWEEGGYYTTDRPHPRGEVVIGGDNVTSGYYKNPHQTARDYYEEGNRRWFRTGDIGQFEPGGSLKIIDRKKDLVKLQFGEYVSLGKVESELKVSPLVENICIYGESSKNNVVAIVSPDMPRLQEAVKTLRNKGSDDNEAVEQLCADKDVVKHVLGELTTVGKKARLEKFELPAAVYLTSDTWTPETGLVTAAFKLRRRQIQNRYQREIESMYRMA